jgi:hypothetical protein
MGTGAVGALHSGSVSSEMLRLFVVQALASLTYKLRTIKIIVLLLYLSIALR